VKNVFSAPLALIFCFFFAASVIAGEGLISVKSNNSVEKTVKRLESILISKGMTLFITIDHAEGAKKAMKELRSTKLVIFGNPKVGTPLMQCAQSTAIDLPQKALIWEDEEGKVWLTYNDPRFIAKRHNVSKCDEVISKIEKALANFASGATSR
jgi:uncharacterized protein (DUF302 family)